MANDYYLERHFLYQPSDYDYQREEELYRQIYEARGLNIDVAMARADSRFRCNYGHHAVVFWKERPDLRPSKRYKLFHIDYVPAEYRGQIVYDTRHIETNWKKQQEEFSNI